MSITIMIRTVRTEEKHIFVFIAMIMNNFLFCIYYALQCQWDPQGDWVSSLLILRCFKCHNITEFDCERQEDNDDVSHLIIMTQNMRRKDKKIMTQKIMEKDKKPMITSHN